LRGLAGTGTAKVRRFFETSIFLGRNFNFISLWDKKEEQRKEILHLFSTFHSPFVETLVSLKDEEGEE
jgi:hypothetical protein